VAYACAEPVEGSPERRFSGKLPHRPLLVSALSQRLLSLTEVREILVPPADVWSKPEQLAEGNPLVPTAVANIAHGHLCGWLRVFIGIHSVPAHWRVGRWSHRESWIWLHQDAAFYAMAAERVSGSKVAVLEVWLPVKRAKTDCPSIGPAPLECLAGLAWLVDVRRLPMFSVGTARRSSYIHVLKPFRRRPANFADRCLWHTQMLDLAPTDTKILDASADGATYLQRYRARC
jgi:hypothetical protein